MPAGNDLEAHAAFRDAVTNQYGAYTNVEELIRVHQASIDPAVRRVGMTRVDEEATAALDLGEAEGRFKDIPEGWTLEAAAVRGNAISGVFVDETGNLHKRVTGANDRYKEPVLTPDEQVAAERAKADARVAQATAELRREADAKIAEVRQKEEERIAAELDKLRESAAQDVQKAADAADGEKEAKTGAKRSSGSS
jgi:hypothetical protein